MKTFSILLASLMALCLCGAASAQCLPPGTEDFEAVVPTSLSYGTASPVVLPAGWAHDLTALQNSWRADSGGTSSSSTGPAIDHTTGTSTGIYLYTETSGGSPGVVAIMTVCFDASTLTTPTIEFWYHMYNGSTPGNMGTLEINQSLDDGVTYASNLFTKTGDQGDLWHWSNYVTPDTSAANGTVNTDVYIQIKGIRGASFNSDMAIDDFKFGEPSVIGWQMNTDGASFDINGRLADGFNGAFVNQDAYLCGGGPVAPVTGAFNWSTTGAANALYETVVDTSPMVALGSGGIALAGGILNLSVASAANWTYLNGGTALSLKPFAPWALPGAVGASRSLGYSLNTVTDLSIQSVFVSPSFASGIELTQGSELHVAVLPPVASIPGPINTSTNITIDVTSGPTCWAPAGVPFYGTSYTTIYVSPNGFVCWGGGGDTDTTPSILDAMNDDGRVGFWTSFDPSEGGTVTIANPAPNLIRVDWVGVWYDSGAAAGTNTFGIEIDVSSGIILVDGLQGIALNTTGISTTDDQWLGISPGLTGPATDPGAQLFAPGGNGAAALTTDMLYEFNDTSLSGNGLPGSLLSGMNQLLFSPDGLGNYNWTGI